MRTHACIGCDTVKKEELTSCDFNEKTSPDWCPKRLENKNGEKNALPLGWKGWIIPVLMLALTLSFVLDYSAFRSTSGSLPVGGASGEYIRGWGYVPFTWTGHLSGTIAFSKSGRTGGVSLTVDGEHYTSDKEVGNQFEVVSSSGNSTIRGNLTIVRYGELETVPVVTGRKQVDYKITAQCIAKALVDNGVDTISPEHYTMLLGMTAFEAKDWVDAQLNQGVFFWTIRDVMAVSAYCQQNPQWENVVVLRNTGRVKNALAILEYEVDGRSYIRPIRDCTWTFCRDTWNWHL